MNLLDALANWATGFVTAAVVAALSLGPSGAPTVSPDVSTGSGILGWAQAVDEQTIQQVGEESQAEDADAEELDAGSPPAEDASSAAGEVAVRQSGDDVELLDQGSPQETATTTSVDTNAVETTAPVTVVESVAPAPTGEVAVTASAMDNGPHLPEGFGEGQVLVSTAAGDFPPGLDECHVGAVTGRAYVGLECDEEGSTFVGHAPTFEDFPFVTDEDFPFENDDPIVADENFPFGDDGPTPTIELNSDSDANSNVFVAAGGRREGPTVSLPEGAEGAVIERAQRSGDDATTDQSNAKKSNRDRSTSISVDASSGNSSDRVQSASKDSSESKRVKNTAGKNNKGGKEKHKQKAKSKEKNKDKNNKKANKDKNSKSEGKKANKSGKGKKENRKKN